jgi:hypothetical protein
MVRLIDIDVPNGRFARRVSYAFFRFGLIISLFYYVPTRLEPVISPYISHTYTPLIQYILTSFSNSPLPYIGIAIALLAFTETVIKGTWVYGVILSLTAFSWLLFDLILLSKGVLFTNQVPTTLIQSYNIAPAEVSLIEWILVGAVVIFMIMDMVWIAKGVRIVKSSRERMILASL